MRSNKELSLDMTSMSLLNVIQSMNQSSLNSINYTCTRDLYLTTLRLHSSYQVNTKWPLTVNNTTKCNMIPHYHLSFDSLCQCVDQISTLG